MLNKLSVAVSPLRMLRVDANGTEMRSAVGSGFFWRAEGRSYLITNWHNVTGVNPETNILMDGWYPNCLQFVLFVEESNHGEIAMARFQHVTIDLYNASDVPQWIEHPLGRHVDCVALPLDIDDGLKLASHVNEYEFEARLNPYVGMDCFIIGYPEGLSADKHTPIWKRASIASEPFLDYQSKPVVLVDTASRKGMSGSPVVVRHSGLFTPGKLDDGVIGTVWNFLGVYSGRVDDDPLGVQLGRIWKGSVITDLIAAKKAGSHPNDVI